MNEEEQVHGFKATLPAQSLKAVLRVIGTVKEEAILKVSPDGMTVLLVDPANASMIDMRLGKSAFTEFAADHCFDLEVDIGKLAESVRVADDLETVSLERSYDEKNLVVSFGYYKYELELLAGLRKCRLQFKIPDTVSVTIPGREFVRMVAAVEAISDHARIGVGVDGEFFMEAVGEGGHPKRTNKVLVIIISAPDIVAKKQVSLYSVDYLQGLAEAVNHDGAVTLEIVTDRPLVAVFEACAGCTVKYMLAPRIKSD